MHPTPPVGLHRLPQLIDGVGLVDHEVADVAGCGGRLLPLAPAHEIEDHLHLGRRVDEPTKAPVVSSENQRQGSDAARRRHPGLSYGAGAVSGCGYAARSLPRRGARAWSRSGLRHTRPIREGHDIVVFAELMGHKRLERTRR